MIQAFFQVAAAATILTSGGPSADAPRARPDPEPVARYSGAAAELEIATPSVESAEISIDGRIDDDAWSHAALLDGFTQFNPVEGVPASQKTEVLVLVDSDAIYFAVRAYDDNPGQIRATLSERDEFAFSDDYIRFIVDTFNDQRRAYVFTVNPYGVQHDGLWNESGGGTGMRGRGMGSPIDANPDFLWDSDARMTDEGWEAEIRVPFKSLRFAEREVQTWGLQVERKIQRNGYESSWAPITGNVANKLTQAGKLNNLQSLDMGLFMELNPVLTGSIVGEQDGLGNFVHRDPTGDFGMNATYGITSNLTLDATYNPDFSQVEADAGQVQVNERFALFFPEKRPFFLEGTEIFGMPQQLVYTRTIANPIAGGKLTGKVGSVNVGYLGAIDESFDDGDPNTYVNLLRVRGDVGASSTIGAVYTDRTINASNFNRVAGADARLQVGGRYTVTLMAARSFTQDGSLVDGALGPRVDGTMSSARFERAGRTFSFNAEFEDSDNLFDPGSGFFQRIGTSQVTTRASYNWYGQRGAFLESINPSIEARGYWDHERFWDGQGIEEGQVQLSSRFSFKDNITIWGNAQLNMFEYQPEQYDGLYVQQEDGSFTPFRPDQSQFGSLPSFTVGLFVNKWERIRGNLRYTLSETPIFDRRFGVAVEPARAHSANASINLYPTHALTAELGANFSRLERTRDGERHSIAVIPRLRTQYQFSRALFARGIFEYGTQESSNLYDPATGLPLYDCDADGCGARTGSVGHDFRFEGLLGFEPSPGTVVYLGYSRQMEDASAFGFENVRPTADGLFIKLSYRFRM